MFAHALKKANISRTLRTLAEQYKIISEHCAEARRDTFNWHLAKLGNSLTLNPGSGPRSAHVITREARRDIINWHRRAQHDGARRDTLNWSQTAGTKKPAEAGWG